MARSMKLTGRMQPRWPFELPKLSLGYAEISLEATRSGRELVSRVKAALEQLLAMPVEIQARALPTAATTSLACARLHVDLGGLPGTATLELEAQAVARWVDLLAGGNGASLPAHEPTFVEHAALELLALIAIDAVRGEPYVETLAPRLIRDAAISEGALTVQLNIAISSVAGSIVIGGTSMRQSPCVPPP